MKYRHPHTEHLRAWGYGDIADAFEEDASSASTLPIPEDWVEASKFEGRIDDAAKALSQLPGGSTLREVIERMARRYHKLRQEV